MINGIVGSMINLLPPEQFLGTARPFLERSETENNLIFGISANILRDRPAGALCLVARRAGSDAEASFQVDGAAVMLPPNNLFVTRMGPEQLAELVDFLAARRIKVPGVVGVAATAEIFAQLWCAKTGATPTVHMRLGAYEIEKVTMPAATRGHLRPASPTELEQLILWCDAFAVECHLSNRDSRKIVQLALAEGRLFVWDIGDALAPLPMMMAGWGGPTPTGVRINMVYTPPANRGKGYASWCVAQLTQQLLDSGRQRCFLYTDLANPTSNRIYQRLGYRFVCDFADYFFAPVSVATGP